MPRPSAPRESKHDVRHRRRGRVPRPDHWQVHPSRPRSLSPLAGKKVFDKPLPNSEPKLRAVFDKFAAKFGTVLVVVDQLASIGALPLTVASDAGCKVSFPNCRGLSSVNGAIQDDSDAVITAAKPRSSQAG